MKTVAISPFHEADEDAVVDLWQRCFPDEPAHNDPRQSIRRKLELQRELFFVAKLDNQVVGTAMSGYDGHRGWIYSVAVCPDHRRLGIGRQLLRHVEKSLEAMGCPKVNLQVRTTNAQIVAFYASCEYAVEERISMGKRLAPQQPVKI